MPSPLTRSNSDSPPTVASNVKKSPSTRISQLVSRFEPPTAQPGPGSPVESSSSSLSLQLPMEAAALSRSWSKLAGGRVEQNVKRFSTDAQPNEGVTTKRRELVKSMDFVEGTVEGMDWTPRARPPVSTPKTDATLSTISPVPPPAARFKHFPRSLTTTDSNARRETKPPGAASTKSSAAQTVLVPASVSLGADGQTKMKIQKGAVGDETRSSTAVKAEKSQHRPATIHLTSSSTPPLPSPVPSYSSATPSLSAPSFTSSEETIVDRPPPIRPALSQRQTSVTFASTEKSLGSPPPTESPSRFDKSSYFPPPSLSPLPFPLDLPSSRPGLSRGGTSFRTTSTAATHSYPAHQIFARDAAPLHLPDLDATLEGLGGSPEFSKVPVNLEMSRDQRQSKSHNPVEMCEIGKDGKGEKSFGSEEEEKAWNDWVRGKPPGLWTRLVRQVKGGKELEDDKERLLDGDAETAGLTKEQHLRSLIFPPFHRLSPDVTLTDLKSNILRPPSFLSANSLLQTAADGILNLFGSAAGIRMTTVEGLRDLMQQAHCLSSHSDSC